MTAATLTTPDQFIIFEGPDGWAWCEMLTADAGHVTVPTPFREIDRAFAEITGRNPGAIVGILDDADDIADAMSYIS